MFFINVFIMQQKDLVNMKAIFAVVTTTKAVVKIGL